MNEIALKIADELIGADRPEKPFNTIEDQRDAIAALIERAAIDLWNHKNKEMAQELATLRIRCATLQRDSDSLNAILDIANPPLPNAQDQP